MTRRHYINNAPVTTLSASLSNVALTCTVTTATGFPAAFPWTACIDPGTATAEVVLVTAAAGTTLTITRGYDGTSAVAHVNGAVFEHAATSIDYDEANVHTSSSSGVHGIVGNVVGDTDTQTLSSKTLTAPTINNGTSNTATLNTPTVNTPTVNNATLNTSLSVGTVGTAAVRARPATAGRALETQDHTGATKLTVDESGNVATPGTLASGAQTVTGTVTATGAVQGATVAATGNATVGGTSTVTGAATAASYTTAGAVTASGVVSGLEIEGALVPTSYTNEAAATAALPSTPTNAIVYLTAPTGGGPPGTFQWSGSAWVSLVGVWQSYTPTLTSWSVGSGTIVARWTQVGKTVTVRWNIVCSGASYGGSVVQVSLPTPAHATGEQDCPTLKTFDGTGNYPTMGLITAGGTTAALYIYYVPSGSYIQMKNGTLNPGGAGNLTGTLVYEAA